ncbi:MAG: phosphoribosylamine--glycine ligase [Pseudomonadota bacterium]
MKILVVGGGGREHALVWKIAQSPKVKNIFCAPGNAGIARQATCLAISSDDIDGLLNFAIQEKIDLTVVGPELPLTAGIVDKFESKGLRVFGASGKAARLEGSKGFAKALMKKYGIPAADSKTFKDPQKAIAYLKKKKAPLVVKADGLAAGKGVILCATEKAATDAVRLIMIDKAFGQAGDTVLIEEMLTGEEASFLVFTDGKAIVPLPTSQDHKAIYDGDKGPNTGGMGAYSPAPVIDDSLHQKIMDEIMVPTVKAMEAEGTPYKGVLYAGLMIENGQAKVLEFNARFGDPETQPLLVRMKTDLVEVMEATIDGHVSDLKLSWDKRASVCVVMAAKGYPASYQKGKPIKGLDAASRMKDVVVFHAGTASKNGKVVTSGGRVLGVTALGDNIEDAIDRAYNAVSKIGWAGAYFRKDIGQKALNRTPLIPLVGIVMGSDSDWKIMEGAADALKHLKVPFEMTIASAHRSPERAATYARSARKRGLRVIIAGAGGAAHLAGSIAACTTLPVIGVPIDSSPLKGLDALLATVQMPSGIPVATMAIGSAGAKNAGILAAQILAVKDQKIAKRLKEYKEGLAEKVAEKAARLEIRG